MISLSERIPINYHIHLTNTDREWKEARRKRVAGGTTQSSGCTSPSFSQKQYFNVAHTIDLGIND